MAEVRSQLGEYAESLISERLDKREEAIIKAVVAKVANGSLTPEYALQQWIAIAEARRLRASLVRESQTARQQYADLLGSTL